MIVNELNPCCDECGNIEGRFDTDSLEYLTGEKATTSRIYCEHQPVCKKYIECIAIPKLANGGELKGGKLPFIQ